jgi:hypothetical protein
LSNYTINFETIIQIDVYEECFLKYTFPSTLGVQELNLNNTEASGLIKSGENLVLTHNLNDESDQPKYIVLSGCKIDKESSEPQENFFNVTFKNLRNPELI